MGAGLVAHMLEDVIVHETQDGPCLWGRGRVFCEGVSLGRGSAPEGEELGGGGPGEAPFLQGGG